MPHAPYKYLAQKAHKLFSPNFFYYDYPSAKPVIFLASSGRSGSTWLQNIISSADNFRIMFEPFWSKRVDILQDWSYRQYIPRNDIDKKRLKEARTILDGRIRNKWIDLDNTSRFPSKRLIKDIRANLFLAWLKKSFPHIRIVLLLRNPFAVARSKILLGWNDGLHLITEQPDLIKTHFENDIDFISNINEPFAKQILFWTLENIVPLRELMPNEALITSYEDIMNNPIIETQRIFSYLNLKSPIDIDTVISKRSRTSWNDRSIKDTPITDNALEESLKILNHFHFNHIYDHDENKAPLLREKNLLNKFHAPK